MSPVTVGVDVGGTKIAGALIDPDGTVLTEQTVPTPRSNLGADPGAVATTSLIHSLVEAARDADLEVNAIGICVPEYVSPTGEISSTEVLAWRPEDLGSTRSKAIVVIDSDVRCAARAEHHMGHGRGISSFMFVSIGTGIAHTFVFEGQLWAGHRGEAIALGELTVDATLALRRDASLTVEQQASGKAIEEVLSVRLSSEQTDQHADHVRAQAGRIVAAAIVSAIALVDPGLVILGGGLGSSNGAFTESLIAHARELLERRTGAPPIRRAHLGNRGGVIGAGLLAHDLARSADEGPCQK